MKKSIFLLLTVVFAAAFLSFVSDEKFPEGISEKAMALYKDHYVKNISNNDDLFNALEFKYPRLIDQVSLVDAQYSPLIGYYYNVFGLKNEKKTMLSIAIDEEEFQQEFLKYDVNRNYGNVEYCYKPLSQQSTCPQECYHYTFSSCSDPVINCGEWDPVTGCPDP